MKLSKFELQTISKITDRVFETIQEALRKEYAEKYENEKKAIINENPNTISLGHLDITKENFELLRKAGIYTIGDFFRMPEAEMLKFPGIGKHSINSEKEELPRLEIEGDKEWESENKPENVEEQEDGKDYILLSDLGIKKKCLEMFLEYEICTIEDYQRRSDAEMKKLQGIGEGAINEVNKALLRLKIPRHIDGENRIEVLNISIGRARALEGMNICTLMELGNAAVGDLLEKSEIGNVGTRQILGEYLMELLVKQELQEMSEIELLKRVKLIMAEIKENTEARKTKMKEILEKLRQESTKEVETKG